MEVGIDSWDRGGSIDDEIDITSINNCVSGTGYVNFVHLIVICSQYDTEQPDVRDSGRDNTLIGVDCPDWKW